MNEENIGTLARIFSELSPEEMRLLANILNKSADIDWQVFGTQDELPLLTLSQFQKIKAEWDDEERLEEDAPPAEMDAVSEKACEAVSNGGSLAAAIEELAELVRQAPPEFAEMVGMELDELADMLEGKETQKHE